MDRKYEPSRNSPCPCGSGKKYKKCCGALASTRSVTSQETDYFRINKDIAYKGKIGRQRENFCVNYIQHKKEIIKDIEDSQIRMTTERSCTISCQKGCCYCCSLYMEATIQECEAIVYYLYRNERPFSAFLLNYPRWREKIRKNGDLYKRCGRFWKENHTGVEPTEIMRQLSEEESRYLMQNIPCPFLVNKVCSIYEVRPYMCAAHVAISPPEFCSPESTNKAIIAKALPLEIMFDRSFYYRDLHNQVLSFMPIAVYEILKGGTMYFSRGGIPGLEKLDYEFLNDPEVKTILRSHGVI